MNLDHMPWFGWLYLFLAITSTAGAVAQLAIDMSSRVAKLEDEKITFNFVIPALLITMTLYYMR